MFAKFVLTIAIFSGVGSGVVPRADNCGAFKFFGGKFICYVI
jgi:hypothetical protein